MRDFRLTLENKAGVHILVFISGQDKFDAFRGYREICGYEDTDNKTHNVFPILYSAEEIS